ncbi:enoyl-CoA hydratase/isomerase family protein [Streptomyces sp. NPDC060002]|uniref:enoyl-CoA hydratase/isomerase family protein n=1 Tax=Streptomyces sp. NPDC060002 TaxID=3347033 RepID=UPI0036CB5305
MRWCAASLRLPSLVVVASSGRPSRGRNTASVSRKGRCKRPVQRFDLDAPRRPTPAECVAVPCVPRLRIVLLQEFVLVAVADVEVGEVDSGRARRRCRTSCRSGGDFGKRGWNQLLRPDDLAFAVVPCAPVFGDLGDEVQEHRDRRGDGCTVAALSGDGARQPADIETEFGAGIGLTGHRLDAAEALYTGRPRTSSPRTGSTRSAMPWPTTPGDPVDVVLNRLAGRSPVGASRPAQVRGDVDWAFGAPTLGEIEKRLRRLGTPWAAAAPAALESASRRSLEITHALLARGRRRTVRECLGHELALTRTTIRTPDFVEGVRGGPGRQGPHSRPATYVARRTDAAALSMSAHARVAVRPP